MIEVTASKVYMQSDSLLKPYLRLLLASGAMSVHIALIGLIHPSGILAYFYFLSLTLIFYKLLFPKKCVLEPLLLYILYATFMLILYALQYLSLPGYIGFSGPRGIGTDDAYFTYCVAETLPSGFIGRKVQVDRAATSNETPFVTLLKFITWYPVTHPLDVLFFTVMATVFIPIFTRELTFEVFKQKKVSYLAFRLMAVAPFLLSNSLILVRDGATAALFMGAVYYFVRRRYVIMGILSALLFYVRIASGLQLVFALGFFVLLRLIQLRKIGNKFFYVVLIVMVGVISTIILYPTVEIYLRGKNILLGGVFFREKYATGFMATGQKLTANYDSAFQKIYQYGPLIRIPLGFTYFFLYPLFVPTRVITNGVFIPRVVLENVIAPILYLFYIKFFIQGIFRAWKDKNLSILTALAAYLALILALSQLSIQFRHKIMILPLFYVIVAYGYYYRTRVGMWVGNLAFLTLFIVQLGRTLLRIF